VAISIRLCFCPRPLRSARARNTRGPPSTELLGQRRNSNLVDGHVIPDHVHLLTAMPLNLRPFAERADLDSAFSPLRQQMINSIYKSFTLDFVRQPIKRLNLVYPYYMNAEMLIEQQRRWLTFPADILDKLRFVIVDDGSPTNPAANFVADTHGNLNLEVYRIEVDIPWNADGARNLGALFCINQWMFLSDVDHFLPLDSLRNVFSLKLRRFDFKRLKAQSAWKDLSELEPCRPHKSTFLIHWELYWKAGGFNENYRGFYSMGWTLRNKLRRVGRQRMLDAYVVEYSREVIPDATTTTLPKPGGEARANIKRTLKRDRKFRESLPANPLRFPWHKEYSSIRAMGSKAAPSAARAGGGL
jgi:hypothetical protein